MKYNELSHNEIKDIINSLIKFIVIDSKKYIAKKQQKKYTLHYLQTLIQITNNEIPLNNKEHTLIESILKDIEKNIS